MFENFKRFGVAATLAGGLVGLGFLVPAAAQADGAAAQIGSAFGDLTGDVTGVYIPAMIALVLLGIGVALGIRWIRRGASST